jgi:hypothetical protein
MSERNHNRKFASVSLGCEPTSPTMTAVILRCAPLRSEATRSSKSGRRSIKQTCPSIKKPMTEFCSFALIVAISFLSLGKSSGTAGVE